jgi:hypothetical protein
MEGGQGANDVPARALSLELVWRFSGALLDVSWHALSDGTTAGNGSDDLQEKVTHSLTVLRHSVTPRGRKHICSYLRSAVRVDGELRHESPAFAFGRQEGGSGGQESIGQRYPAHSLRVGNRV